MAITTTQAQQLYVAYFGRPADPAGLNFWTQAGSTNTMQQQSNNFATAPEWTNAISGMTNDQIVNLIYINSFGRSPEPAGLRFWSDAITNGILSVGDAAWQIVTNTGPADAAIVAAKVTAAIGYTDAVAADTTDSLAYSNSAAFASANSWLDAITTEAQATAALVPATLSASLDSMVAASNATYGETYTLTTGVDNFTGTDYDDTFNAALDGTSNTLNAQDRLNGVEGTDTLNAIVNASVTPISLQNIEVINITATAAATVGLINAGQATEVTNSGSTAELAVTGLAAAATNLYVYDTSSHSSFGYISTAGTQTVNLALDNVTGTSELRLAGIENINITSGDGTTQANTLAAFITDGAATTLTVAGDADLTITRALATDNAAITSVDASAFTGDLDITTGALGNSATTVSVLGGTGDDSLNVSAIVNVVSVNAGAGDDTVTVANINSLDYVDGGTGNDTLAISGNAGQIAPGDAASVSNFETLNLIPGGGGTITQDMDAFSGITEINAIGAATTVAFTDVGADVATLGSVGAITTVSAARKADTSADSLAVNLGSATAGTTITNLTLNNEETISITSQGGANTITNLNASDLVTLNVAGAQNAALGTIVGATVLATVDASSSTGTVSFNGAASLANMTVTAGSGALTATTGTGNDSITGGVRGDNLTAGAGNDTILAADGNDTIDGGDGNDSILGGAGNDSITAGTGNDYIHGGAGDDTVVVTSYTSGDTLDGGEGTNTLAITTAAATTTPSISNFQTVDVTFGGSHTLALADSTSTNLVINELTHGAAQAVSVTGIASGATFRNLDDDDTITLDTAAAGTLTVDARIANGNALTITDAASVTVTNGGADPGSFAGINLDTVDTTALTITGGTGGDLGTGAIGTSDNLATLSVSSSTAAQDVTVGDMADADSLTSLTVAGAFGNVTLGEIGGTLSAASGTAENLATVTVSATSGSIVTLDEIWADTTDSVTDNAMVLTASATNGSSVSFDDITNTFGSITAGLSGDGAVNFTGGSGTLTANDVTLTRSGAGATTIDAIDAGNDVTITATGSGAFTLTTVDAEGDLLLDASAASGALTVTSTSEVGTSIYGGSANDLIVGGNSSDTSLVGNAGDDTITGGNGNDIILGGDGNDSITAGGGVDSLSGGAGNDTFVLGTTLTSADTVDGGTGTNTATLTTSVASATPSLTNIQTLDVTFGGSHTLALADSTSTNLVINELTVAAQAVSVTGIASGATFRNLDDNDTITLDTAAAGTLTFDQRVAGFGGTLTVTDAAAVTFVNGNTGAVDTDVDTVTLDNVDTTAITVQGATVASNTTSVGATAVNNTNALQSITVTTSTTGATATLGAVADADGLTSLTVTAANADATVGAIGAGGSAEGLATVTVSSSGVGVTAVVGAITADTTNSTTDNAMTVTASAGASATTTFGNINNEFGTITLNASGQGAVNSTGTLTAVDLTLNRTDSGNSSFSAIALTGDAALTLAGAGTFTLGTSAVDGELVIDASGKTGSLVMTTNNSTGTASITGGDAADTIMGGAGNDTLIGGAGNDSIGAGSGNDSIVAGSGDDAIVMSTYLATGDNIDGGTGDNTLDATINSSRTATISNVQTLNFDMSGGSFNAANVTGADTLNLTSTSAGNAVLTNLASTVTTINQNEDAAVVNFGYRTGAAATVTLDYDAATEVVNNTSTTFSNVASLTVDGDDTSAVDLGSLTGGSALTTLAVNGGGANLTTGALSAANLQSLTVTTGGAGDISVGALGSAVNLNSITLTGAAETGNITVGDIGTTVGFNAAVLTSLVVTTDALGGTVVDMADIDATNADITTFSVTLDGSYGASDIGTVTADNITSIDINTSATGTSFTVTGFVIDESIGAINITNDNDVVFTNGITMGASGTVGNVTITASDTFTNNKIEGLAIGNIVASNSGAGRTVAIGAVGDSGGTVGNITFSDDGNFSITVNDVLTVGDVDTTDATGTSTVTLNNSTLVGVNMTGADGVDVFTGTGAGDVISTGASGDTLDGNGGADVLEGGAGDDLFLFNAGDVATGETFDGGDGDNTLRVVTSTSFVDLTTATILTAGNIQNIQITDATTGTFLGSQLTGQAISVNGTGAGISNLAVSVSGATAVDLSTLTFAAAGGTAFVSGTDTVTITGNGSANTITGTSLADSIDGAGNTDTINGGDGADSITGGAAADSLSGNAGSDIFYYAAQADLEDGTTLVDAAVAGGTGTNRISVAGGLSVANTVSFGNASDIQELYVTGTAGSTIALDVSAQTAGIATINISASTTAGNTVDVSEYTALGATITGSSTATNTLTGGDAADEITGGSDSDTIRGNAGADTLTGNGGSDDFIMNGAIGAAGAITIDEVTDFLVANDQVGNYSIANLETTVALSDLVKWADATSQGAGAIVTESVSGAVVLGTTAGSNVLLLDDTLGSTSAVENALEDGGGLELTVNNAWAIGDGALVVWDNGTDSFIGLATTSAIVASGANFATGNLTVQTLVTLTGVADATTVSNSQWLDYLG